MSPSTDRGSPAAYWLRKAERSLEGYVPVLHVDGSVSWGPVRGYQGDPVVVVASSDLMPEPDPESRRCPRCDHEAGGLCPTAWGSGARVKLVDTRKPAPIEKT